MTVDVVIPTIGRPSLGALLGALASGTGPPPRRIIVVDDRKHTTRAPLDALPRALESRLTVVRGRAVGPAAARNVGWRASDAEWIAFLDDDVVTPTDWLSTLIDDLRDLPDHVAGSQGRIRVPLPLARKATDWERNVNGLESARWATADMAYRRAALETVGGFDERFPRAYREDADLALRMERAGFRLVVGRRSITHSMRPASRWVSVKLQAGNADDALMRALHGSDWRARAGVPRGRRRAHALTVAAAVVALAGLTLRRRSIARGGIAVWIASTASFAWARIAPGPRTRSEITTMLATSVVVPFAAIYHWMRGWLALPRTLSVSPSESGALVLPQPSRSATRPRAVLFDRDGTLVVDVPYNGDPARVLPMPGASQAIERLRAAGIKTAVISNQRGVARGWLSMEQVHAVNRRIDEALGPLGAWLVCPHDTDEGCACRKPAPGLVYRAAAALGVRPSECVVIGDTGADVGAALAAGARAILVPTAITRRAEIDGAPEVAPDIAAAVERVLAIVPVALARGRSRGGATKRAAR